MNIQSKSIRAGANAGTGPESTDEEESSMSKNIVVITGSPRKNGNSFAMTDAFIQAAQAKGPHRAPASTRL